MNTTIQSDILIDELAALICTFTRPQDAVRLAATSRYFFELAIPIAWKHVEGVTQILKLVSGSRIYMYKDEDEIDVTCIVSCTRFGP
jgi:hypothetical protein